MNYQIKNRFDDSVIFETECESLKDCVELAVSNGANLDGASLDGASLDGANLNRANLDGASLNRANLNGANLDGANLDRANLNGASLDGANLNRANLDGASLDGANLYGASLNGANLNRANLDRASYGEGVGMERPPLQILMQPYNILILDTHLKIGCEIYSFDKWQDFPDDVINEMDGNALDFWRQYKEEIFALIIASGRTIGESK